jgi:hypothetical protein
VARREDTGQQANRNIRYTREYQRFRKSDNSQPETRYERLAKRFWNIRSVKLSSIPVINAYKDRFEDHIEVSRMEIDVEQIGSLLILPLLILVPISLFATALAPSAVALFTWFLPAFWTYWVMSYPNLRSTVVRIKSSDESLRVILYMAMQLEMTPNLSKAVRGAASNTSGYLSRDLSEAVWESETNQKKLQNTRQALSERVDLWRKWSPSFVESLQYLIDSISRTGDEKTRIIEKGEDKIIEDMKNEMSQYARDLSSPIRVLNMAGIMLPLMGLIMFPLMSIFIGGSEAGVGTLGLYMSIVYLFILPSFLFFLVKRLISKRPGAYSNPSLENVDDVPPKNKVKVKYSGDTYSIPLKPLAITIGFVIAIPGIIYYFNLLNTIISYETVITFTPSGGGVSTPGQWGNFIKSQYKVENAVPNVIKGMSLFWGVSAGLITFFLGRSYSRQKIRERIQRIEEDIQVGLTELDNTLSKGVPVERSIYGVIQKFNEIGASDSPLENFFEDTYYRMQEGSPFKKAVFDTQNGTINNYPSGMLRNAMQMLADSSRRGPSASSQNLRRINEYISNQKEVEETIKELLDETVSQMNIQSKFIAPIITGAAGSMALIIVQVLFLIAQSLEEIQNSLNVGSSSTGGITEQVALIKNVDSALPPTLILLIVSLYLVEVSLILAYFKNGISNGFDEISRDIEISRTLIYATSIFSLIVIVSALIIMPTIPGILEV